MKRIFIFIQILLIPVILACSDNNITEKQALSTVNVTFPPKTGPVETSEPGHYIVPRRTGHEAIALHARTDHRYPEGGRGLSEVRYEPVYILRLAEEVSGDVGERGQAAQGTGGREPSFKAAGGESFSG